MYVHWLTAGLAHPKYLSFDSRHCPAMSTEHYVMSDEPPFLRDVQALSSYLSCTWLELDEMFLSNYPAQQVAGTSLPPCTLAPTPMAENDWLLPPPAYDILHIPWLDQQIPMSQPRFMTESRPVSCRSLQQGRSQPRQPRQGDDEPLSLPSKSSYRRTFSCPESGCQRTYSRNSDLERHRRTHTGQQPYLCPEPSCPKAFSQKSNLNRHLRTHRNERPFSCPRCGKKFTQQGHVNRHIKLHNRNHLDDSSTDEDGNDSSSFSCSSLADGPQSNLPRNPIHHL